MAADSIAELVATFGLAVDEASWTKGMELLEKARSGVEKLGEASKKAEKEEGEATGELNEKLKQGLETLFGYEGIKTIDEMVEHTMEATIQAKHLGERLGITTQKVQALGYAADVSGASSAVMANALQRLSFNLNQTGLRTSFAQHAFSQLGISMATLKKMPLDEQLGLIAEKFKKMPDGQAKVALAMQLFGRTAGPELVPLLNEGKEGIAELTDEAEKLGVTTGEENVEKAEKLERAQKKLQARWGAMKDELAFALIPVITRITDAFSALSDFLRAHQGVMVALLGGLAAALIYVGVSAAIAWAAVIGPIVAVVAGVAAVIGFVEMLIDLFEGKLHGAIKGVAILIAVMFLPLTMLIAIIYGIVKVVKLLIEHWDEFTDKVQDAWDYFTDGQSTVSQVIMAVVGAVKYLIAHIDMLLDKLKGVKKWGSDLLDMIPGVGIVRTGIGLARGEGAGAFRHAIPGLSLGIDAVNAARGADDDTAPSQKVEVHSQVTIHTGATKEDVQRALDDHHEKIMRDAHHELKRGG